MLRSFSVLRERHLRLLWLGQLLSAFGDRFFEIGVIWLSVQIGGSEAGFVLAAGSGARLATGLLGGVFADRWEKRRSMIGLDLLRAASLFSLPLAAMLGDITLVQLAVVAAVEGALSSIFVPTLQSALPRLTDGSGQLQASNALLDATSRMARIFAPGLAGLIIAVLPIEQFFTIDGITFLVSAIAIIGIGGGGRWGSELAQTSRKGWRGIVDELWGSIALVRRNRAVFWSILSYIPYNIVWSGAITVGLALLADGKLGVGVRGYSFLLSAYGVGSVFSNLIVGSVRIQNRARLLFGGILLFGIGVILLGMSQSYLLALLAMVVAAMGTPMSDLMILLMIQEEFPPEQVGKVYSLRLTVSNAGSSAGLLAAAYWFQGASPQAGMLWYGLLALLVGAAGVRAFRAPTRSLRP